MDRTRKTLTIQFVLDFTDEEYNAIISRDAGRRRYDALPLYLVLEDGHPVTDVTYYNNAIFYTLRPWNDTEEQHNLIADDIECYIAGLETLLTGLDNGEEM